MSTIEYVGIVLGGVGAITGVIGSIISIKSYKNVQKVKSLDLRLALKREVSFVRSQLEEAEELLPRSYESRLRVLSALGRLQSGESVNWKATYEKDLATIQSGSLNFERTEKNIQTDSYSALEEKLDSIEQTKLQIMQIVSKYRETLKQDDQERVRLRERCL